MDTASELAIDRQLVKRILLYLKIGKHVILVGAPGVGKTELARRILRIVGQKVVGEGRFLECVASDEWSRYEVIGGINLKDQFQEGWITKAAVGKSWLLIDEFNRSTNHSEHASILSSILELMTFIVAMIYYDIYGW